MIYLELLAPAKDLECGKAAIDHGADAVYIGAPKFGARSAAGNSVADIRELCDYAHRYSAKVFVTINTLVYDDEITECESLLLELKDAGVDAIIAQDMAVASMVKGMGLHASTQTDNRSPEKVRWLYESGFSRVVLARELTIDEISNIHTQVPNVSLEAFVHGALCVGYSGICYASQHCFNRSANRGECAQFCRLPFDLVDSDGKVIEKNRFLLSLKDLNQSANIDKLIEAGVTSFKIEGRLKDVAYVKNVTSFYNNVLNNFISKHPGKYSRSSLGRCTYNFQPDLNKTFNRGFTSYFLNGRRPDIFSPNTPKAIGEYVGTVKEIGRGYFKISSLSSFANGDGLCYLTSDKTLEGFRVNKAEGNKLFPLQMPKGLRIGISIYRNHDHDFEKILAKQSSIRKILINISIDVTSSGFEITAKVPGSYTVKHNYNIEHQIARTNQKDQIINQFKKMGNTVYECSEVIIPDNFQYFIPNSIISQMRRDIIDELNACISCKRIAQEKHANGLMVSNGLPRYNQYPYLHNIANSIARKFYNESGLENCALAYEVSPQTGKILMQCRHCLRYSFGVCSKSGVKPSWREPLYLVSSDGRRFRLEFDCRKCQMNIFQS